MTRTYRRDSKGRFAGGGGGSGTFKSGRKAVAKGKDARSDAKMMKTLKGGEREGGQISARAARSSARTVRRRTTNSADMGFVSAAGRKFTQDANKSKAKQRKMERERRSLARKGARQA